MISTLNPTTGTEAGATSWSAALTAETLKYGANDHKWWELDWVYLPMAVETYGC